MSRVQWLPVLGLAGWLAIVSSALGQGSPYIGYVYPAGGQQGTMFPVKLGGQRLEGVSEIVVTGTGVSARLVEHFRSMGNQEMSLLTEQLRELRRNPKGQRKPDGARQEIIARIERRMAEYCNRPACAALSELVFAEVTIQPDAEPGVREIRLVTARGVSTPLAFHVGQVPEVARKPMRTSDVQVLGKEGMALRNRPAEEVEQSLTLPCTVNGQIASGEVNWYRFPAVKGERLVLSVAARQLIPYIADAVPGWFQPVLAVCDASGKQLAFNDDFRFQPDPTLLFEVPADGEYRFSITDAIYRGREDFVYRVTIGELPFVTSIFPLGGPAGAAAKIEMQGWNLEGAELTPPPADAAPGVYRVVAHKDGLVSNGLPFALDTLPECLERESNNNPAQAQHVELPVIVNGRIDVQDDWDVFRVAGRAGEKIVAEVTARRLDSPLDSLLKITDESGKLLAFNDDHEDVGSGVNTHHADSYLMFELPADGSYCVHLGDTARNGGQEFAYRLRISPPRPDFVLRVVPSSAALRRKIAGTVNVFAIRQDGFSGEIELGLQDPPEGITSTPVTLPGTNDMVQLGLKTTLSELEQPVSLTVQGRAMVDEQEIVRAAVPAEDRMQAFLWRHLVPAQSLQALVFDPYYQSPATREPPPAFELKDAESPPKKPNAKFQFTKQQVAGRLKQLRRLYEEWLLTEQFYARKIAECEAVE